MGITAPPPRPKLTPPVVKAPGLTPPSAIKLPPLATKLPPSAAQAKANIPTATLKAPATSRALATKPAATSQALAQVQKPDIDFLRQRRAALKKESTEAKNRQGRMQLKEGKNTIRILPGVGPSPFHEVWIHYLKNPAEPGKNGRPVACPLKNRNKPCIVCQKVSALNRTTNQLDIALAKDIRSGRRVLANVIDINNKDGGVQILEMGKLVYDELLKIMCGDEENPEDFPAVDYTDPDGGFNVIIEKEVGDPNNVKFTTKYEVKVGTKPSAVPILDWQKKLHDLAKVHDDMGDDKVRAIMEGETEEDVVEREKAEAGAVDAAHTVIDDLEEEA